MIFGFNTDVPAKAGIYHVQTEDRGPKRAVIESVIYIGGKIMGRKRTSYEPDEVSAKRIEEMVRRQHKDLVEAIRSGTWAPSEEAVAAKAHAVHGGYGIQLLNPDELHHGEFLRFEFSVREGAEAAPAAGVRLDCRWVLGDGLVEKQSLVSKADGGVELWLPKPSDHQEGTLLISATGPAGRELAKFVVKGVDGE